MMQEHLKIQTLKKSRLFMNLPLDEMKRIAAKAHPVLYKKHCLIFHDDQPSKFFYVVHDGLVKIYKSSASGKNMVFAIAGCGDTLNATALTEGKYFFFAKTISNTTLLRLDRQTYLDLFSSFPAIAEELIGLLVKRLDLESSRVVTMMSEKVEQRLVIVLWDLFRKFGETVPITRRDLASCVGTTTETAIRVLNSLKKRGLIERLEGQYRIHITNPSKLEELTTKKEDWF